MVGLSLQNVVNKWTKVNRKHVVFGNELENNGRRDFSSNSNTSNNSAENLTNYNVPSRSSSSNYPYYPTEHHFKGEGSSSSTTELGSTLSSSPHHPVVAGPGNLLRKDSSSKPTSKLRQKGTIRNDNTPVVKNNNNNNSIQHLQNDLVSSSSIRSTSSYTSNQNYLENNKSPKSSIRKSRRRSLERSNSQSELLRHMANASGETEIRSDNVTPPLQQHMMMPSDIASIYSGNSSIASYCQSYNNSPSVDNQSAASSRVLPPGMTLQQVNSMRWVNEGYDRAQPSRHHNHRSSSKRAQQQHLQSSPVPNVFQIDGLKMLSSPSQNKSGRSSGNSNEGSSKQKLSARRNRLQNHLADQQDSIVLNTAVGPVRVKSTQAEPLPLHGGKQILNSDVDIDGIGTISDEDNNDSNNNNNNSGGNKYAKLQRDLEYLKSIAMRAELCEQCAHKANSRSAASSVNYIFDAKADMNESVVNAASRRLNEMTVRHRRQIEQIARERARWQNDMHLKLSKLTMMCKGMNDESTALKEELKSTRKELSVLQNERDALLLELEEIKSSKVEKSDFIEIENKRLQEMVEDQRKSFSLQLRDLKSQLDAAADTSLNNNNDE